MQIPFHKTHTTEEEIEAAKSAIKSGWLTMGPKTVEFENKFKQFLGCCEAVSMNSATAALHLALKAIGLQRDDEVIVPTNTFVATAEVVTYFDAIPVLCDIEETTHNIDVSKIEDLITNKTKAIIPVHFAGQAWLWRHPTSWPYPHPYHRTLSCKDGHDSRTNQVAPCHPMCPHADL